MKSQRIRTPWSGLLFLLATPVLLAQGSSGIHFGIAGGVSFPTQQAGDAYDTGWHASAMLNFNAPVAPVGVRFEGMYSRMPHKASSAGSPLEMGGGTANIVLGPRAIAFRPYFIGGGGFYRVKFTAFPGTRFAFEDTQDKFGWNAGGGLSFGVGPITTIFIEARYIQVQTDANFAAGSHLTFVPVTVGFVF